MSLEILPTAWRSIVSHAESCYPQEACGALLGTKGAGGWTGVQALEMRNVAPRPKHAYELDPEEIEAVERLARRRGMGVIAWYHSHPDAPPEMSVDDLRLGCPLRWNVILSVVAGEVQSAACYAVSASRIAAFPKKMVVAL